MRRVGKGFSGRDTPLFPTMMVQAQQEQVEGSTMPTDPQHTPTIIQPSTSQPQLKQRSRRLKRKDTKVPQPSGPTDNVADEAVMRIWMIVCSGPKRQDTMGDTIARTRFENVPKTSNDSLLTGVNTPQIDEDRLKLNELMEFCTNLQNRVIDLENTKTAQGQEITSLKLRVEKLEKKGGSRTHKLKRLYKVGRSIRVISSNEASLGDQEDASKQRRKIDDIDKDAEITLDMAKKEINVAKKEVSTADLVTIAGEVVTTASVEISTASPTETVIADNLTLAQTLIEIKSEKPKVKMVMIGEQSESTTRKRPQQLPSKDKGKGIMVQAMIDADYQMAQQIQAEEQEKLSVEENSKLFVQLLEARKKHFTAIRAQEK
ncbi:hypothetical protein Tco_1016056 [Tanacetum coccineum]|uniref:Uncharacterized protein n=1 Tax=Tanacetum coccineum TaxID=301880 RepID=A0ABQ5FMN8_9ASTR